MALIRRYRDCIYVGSLYPQLSGLCPSERNMDAKAVRAPARRSEWRILYLLHRQHLDAPLLGSGLCVLAVEVLAYVGENLLAAVHDVSASTSGLSLASSSETRMCVVSEAHACNAVQYSQHLDNG